MMRIVLLFAFLAAHLAAFDVHANAFETQALPGHVPSALSAAEPVGALSRTATSSVEPLALTVVLRRSDPTGFQAYLRDVYDIRSPQFRKFLNPREVSDRFGPSAEDYAAVRAWFEQQGFLLTERSANRMTMIVSGTRVLAEDALDVNIGDYTLDERHFFANDRDPRLPKEIARRVQAVIGLSNFAEPYRRPVALVKAKEAKKCVDEAEAGDFLTTLTCGLSYAVWGVIRNLGCYLPNLFGVNCETVNFGPPKPPTSQAASLSSRSVSANLEAAATGAGQTIGIVAFDSFKFSDVSDFLALVGAPAEQIDQLSLVNVNGGAPIGPDESEVLLDVSAVMMLAPGAEYVVYSAPFTGSSASFQAVLNRMVGDAVTVISNSWSYCEDQTTFADVQSIDAILAGAAASGISVFNASGDTGSSCLDGSPDTIGVPANSPHATAVGGTSVTFGPGGTYMSETWWDGIGSIPPTGQGGFGVSRFFPRPSYQDGFTASPMRSIPDIADNADPAALGVPICQSNAGGCPSGLLYGGTSLSAPMVAASTAVLNEAQGFNLGWLNPLIYPLAGTNAFHSPASMGSDFAHVGLGSPNYSFLHLGLAGVTPGLPDAELSIVSAVSPTVDADGVSTTSVGVQLRDSNGSAVNGKTVTLAADSGNVIITPASGVSNVANGTVIFTVTNATIEDVTFTATDVTDGIELMQEPVVSFVEPPATSGGIDAFPTIVPADGVTTSTITVTLLNAMGDGAQGKEVTLDQGAGRSVASAPTPALTDANGEVTFEVTNLFTEDVSYTAIDVTDGNLVIPRSTSVSFTNGAPQFCNIGEPVPEAGFAVSSFATSFPFGIFGFCQGAAGMAFDAAGNLFVVDEADGNLYKFGAAGGVANATTKVTAAPYPLNQCVQGLAFSKDGEHLYMARQGCGTGGDVVEISPTDGTVLRVVAPDILCATGIATDPISGDLFVSSPCPPGNGITTGGTDKIHRIADPESATPVVSVYSSPGHAQGLTFTPDGTLWATPLDFGPPLRRDIVRIDGTDSATPGAFSILFSAFDGDPLIAATAAVPSLNPDDPGSPTTLTVANGNGGINGLDLTQAPPTITPVATGGDAVVFMISGPDGCLYSDDMDRVVRVTAADGSCNYAPTTAAPILLLNPTTANPDPVQGSQLTMTAQFANISVPEDTPVVFSVFGANEQPRLGRTDASGQATVEYQGAFAGNDRVIASATVDDVNLTSSPAQVNWVPGPHVSFLSLNTSPETATEGIPVTFRANLTDVSVDPVTAIPGAEIQFSVDGETCSADTDASGNASCELTLHSAGTFTLTASFSGSAQLLPASQTQTLLVLDKPTPPTTLCEARTAYGPGKCRGTFRAATTTDLDEYIATDFGKNGGSQFKNLRITASLEGLDRKIESPCKIRVDPGVELQGDLVSVDALTQLKFTQNVVIDAVNACLLSPQGKITLGTNSQASAANMTIEAKSGVKVGSNATLNTGSKLVIRSTGTDKPKRSRVTIGSDAKVTVGGDMELTAQWKAEIAKKATVDVNGNLNMDAGAGMKCIVASSATVNYGAKSGNCAPMLP